MRRRKLTAGHESGETGIDLAPMLDFVLNLLIFFIITAVSNGANCSACRILVRCRVSALDAMNYVSAIAIGIGESYIASTRMRSLPRLPVSSRRVRRTRTCLKTLVEKL